MQIKLVSWVFIGLILFSGCTRYQEIADAEYSEQQVYMPAASVIPYDISKRIPRYQVPTPDSSYRFYVRGNKLIIPLAVVRGGINLQDEVAIQLTKNDEAISELIASDVLSGTILLPSRAYTFPPSIQIGNEKDYQSFDVEADLNFIQSGIAGKYAFAISIASAGKKINDNLKTAIVLIDKSTLNY